MNFLKRNIDQVVSQKLCNACGACLVSCQINAISFTETIGGNVFPRVDATKCNDCGLCLRVCPGINFCGKLLGKIPQDPFAGDALVSYIGRAMDETIFRNSQSGGVASALLCYALESGFADAAVTVTMRYGNPPRPEVRLARTVKGIVEAQKSKYSLAPVLKALKDLKKEDQKIIVVGLPCHIHGLWNLYGAIPELKQKIALTIGLFCDKTLSNAAIDYFIDSCNFKSDQEKTLIFRDKQQGGYPGDVVVKTRDGEEKVIPSRIRIHMKDYFVPPRCRICIDKLNIFADISVGDPWGVDEADFKNGETVCVARTDKGRDFMQKAEDYVQLRELGYEKICNGQKIEDKSKEWHSFKRAWNQQNLDLPNYCQHIKAKPEKLKLRKYKKKLKSAFELDSFSSREDLLDCINVRLKRQRIYFWLLKPVKLCNKLLRIINQKARRGLSVYRD